LGRGNFILLNKVTTQIEGKMSTPFTAPPSSQRLFDLVKPVSDDVLPAFYHALRDTLVVDTLEDALRYYKLVTSFPL
jgi:structural maintenance of chromosome 4